MAIPPGYYESLIEQIEIDFKNLKESFEAYKGNPSDGRSFDELCQNYAFLLKDIEYLERMRQNFSGIGLPISGRILKDLRKIEYLLNEVGMTDKQ